MRDEEAEQLQDWEFSIDFEKLKTILTEIALQQLNWDIRKTQMNVLT